MDWYKRDRYGRIVGKVVLNGEDICLEQIRAGYAWHYKKYQDEQSAEERALYAESEAVARSEKRGLWKDRDPVPPWAYRQIKANGVHAAPLETFRSASLHRPVHSVVFTRYESKLSLQRCAHLTTWAARILINKECK